MLGTSMLYLHLVCVVTLFDTVVHLKSLGEANDFDAILENIGVAVLANIWRNILSLRRLVDTRVLVRRRKKTKNL